LRTLTLQLRWRLIAGMISAMMVVGLTLPGFAARVDLGARVAEIWPNVTAFTADVIWPNLPVDDVIWPNQPLDAIDPQAAVD